MSINMAFSRELLKQVLDEIRAYRKSTDDRFAFKLTDAWVHRVGTDHWEFHFGEFYWHGSADGAFEARTKRLVLVAGRAGWKLLKLCAGKASACADQRHTRRGFGPTT